jgi:Tfp pilus assembly protein PilX
MNSPKTQRGMALVVGLILLALMTVMAITSFNIGRTSLDIVGNMQQRQQVIVAANSAIQEAISTVRLFQAPDAIFLNPCNGKANTRCFDLNDDGETDIEVELTPKPFCVNAQVIPNGALTISDINQAGCATGVSQTFGIEGTATGSSLCANSVWEVTAVAVDKVTGAEVVVTSFAADARGLKLSSVDGPFDEAFRLLQGLAAASVSKEFPNAPAAGACIQTQLPVARLRV